MEMMRNPNAMAEAMRSQDLAMSQLENLPGGFNALRRMYEDVQEPMMEAAANAAATANTGTNTAGASSSGAAAPGAAPNNAALPNPWGANPAGNIANAFGASPFGMGANPWAAMGGAGGNPMMEPFGGGGMGAGGMDPQQMAAMMQNPFMQQMMQQMLNDPATIQQVRYTVTASHHHAPQMTAMNPELGAALQNPQVRAMMTNPQFLSQMANPANMQAMMQMQQSMNQLRASGLMPNAPGPNPFNPFAFAPQQPFGGASGAPAGGLNFNSLFGAPGAPGQSPFFGMPPMPPAAAPAPAVDPATRYAAQIQQLQDMGFADADANLQALIQTGGNVNAAVERLLGGR